MLIFIFRFQDISPKQIAYLKMFNEFLFYFDIDQKLNSFWTLFLLFNVSCHLLTGYFFIECSSHFECHWFFFFFLGGIQFELFHFYKTLTHSTIENDVITSIFTYIFVHLEKSWKENSIKIYVEILWLSITQKFLSSLSEGLNLKCDKIVCVCVCDFKCVKIMH